MPNLKQFRALRYNQDIAGPISELVAPPYDIIYDGWRERLYQRNPHNIIRLIKTKGEPGDTENNNKYTRANDYIRTWMDKGVLRLEDKPSIYLRSDTYNLNGEIKTRYGFISLLQVEDRRGFPASRPHSVSRGTPLRLARRRGVPSGVTAY